MNEEDMVMEDGLPCEEAEGVPEDDDRDAEMNELKALLDEKTAEITRLRRAAYCTSKGISEEYAEDVMSLAQIHAERENISFEEAADRLCMKLFGSSETLGDKNITTGVRTENSRKAENDRLRRAFGLNG